MTENPTPQKGDRVRVTFTGIVRRECIGYNAWQVDTSTGVFTVPSEWVEVLAPEEPPIGSVLLDRGGLAWQRLDDIWRSVDHDRYTWAYLQCLKPLNVIHRGGDDD